MGGEQKSRNLSTNFFIKLQKKQIILKILNQKLKQHLQTVE